MYWVGVFTAGMTAFYVFRAFFLAFFGEPRWKTAAHATPMRTMLTATVSRTSRRLDVDSAGDSRRAEPGRRLHQHPEVAGADVPAARRSCRNPLAAYVSVAAGLIGIALAYLFYVVAPAHSRSRWRAASARLYRWIYNKYFVDEFYDSTRGRTDDRRLAHRCCGASSTPA